MNYYLDTEFNEGLLPQRILGIKIPTWLSKPKHTIDLISIGMVSEDGREYYAISKDFDLRAAYYKSDGVDPKTGKKIYWLRENVLKPLYDDLAKKDWNRFKYLSGYYGWGKFSYWNLKRMVKYKGKTKSEIAQEIKYFTYPIKQIADFYYVSTGDMPDIVSPEKLTISDKKGRLTFSIFDPELKPEFDAFKPVFYAYFADYDWVVFCTLFGNMINLPNGYPMYCCDLKQILDDYVTQSWLPGSIKFMQGTGVDVTFDLALKKLKGLDTYPKQENEHIALADAAWNKKLHNFLLEVTKKVSNLSTLK